jgi:hypothetical protein
MISLEEINMWTVWLHESRLGEGGVESKADHRLSYSAEVKNVSLYDIMAW